MQRREVKGSAAERSHFCLCGRRRCPRGERAWWISGRDWKQADSFELSTGNGKESYTETHRRAEVWAQGRGRILLIYHSPRFSWLSPLESPHSDHTKGCEDVWWLQVTDGLRGREHRRTRDPGVLMGDVLKTGTQVDVPVIKEMEWRQERVDKVIIHRSKG